MGVRAYNVENPFGVLRMNNCCRLSNVTKEYLYAFQEILDLMIQGMTEAELMDSISHNFIVQMIPHHRAAIEMSHNILNYTTNIPLQDIALQIISEQTKSIEDMERIVCGCSALQNTGKELSGYQCRMEEIMRTMFDAMGSACVVNDVNVDFMRQMIPHHLGAVRMSELTLKYCICRELVPILTAIITSQKRGIMQMQRLLRCMGC